MKSRLLKKSKLFRKMIVLRELELGRQDQQMGEIYLENLWSRKMTLNIEVEVLEMLQLECTLSQFI